MVATLPWLVLAAMTIAGSACSGDDNNTCTDCSETNQQPPECTGDDCGEDDERSSNCSDADFRVGGTVSINAAGGAQQLIALQAVADYANAAITLQKDITAACRSIAKDLDANAAEQGAADAKADGGEREEAWCQLAVNQIVAAKANCMCKVSFDPPQCSMSVPDAVSCLAECVDDSGCDMTQMPPMCEGGRLIVSCAGQCTAMGGSYVRCEGRCEGACVGACTAPGGVACMGACDGTCNAFEGEGGLQPDGTCYGTCAGTCEQTAPGAMCSGTCRGVCDASCSADAGVPALCDGVCSADPVLDSCIDGRIRAGCPAVAACDDSCYGISAAHADCAPPAVDVKTLGCLDTTTESKLRGTLPTNLGAVLAAFAKVSTMENIGASLADNVSHLTGTKPACLPIAAQAIHQAQVDLAASHQQTQLIVMALQ